MAKRGRRPGQAGKPPEYEKELNRLRAAGKSYHVIAELLTAKGYRTSHGQPLTIDTLRNRTYYRKKSLQK